MIRLFGNGAHQPTFPMPFMECIKWKMSIVCTMEQGLLLESKPEKVSVRWYWHFVIGNMPMMFCLRLHRAYFLCNRKETVSLR